MLNRMRGYLFLVFFVMIIILLKPHHCGAAADSWVRSTNITADASSSCGAGHHDCLIADHADTDMFMDPGYLSTVLSPSSGSRSFRSQIANKPAVVCPRQERYNGCLSTKKVIKGQPRCGSPYNREPICQY